MSVYIEDLKIIFSEKVIVNIEKLELERKCFHAIIGMNGSGKTTLVKSFLNLVDKGSIKGKRLVENTEMGKLKGKKLAKLIAYVPQKNQIEYDFSVEDLIKMGGFHHKKFDEKHYIQVIEKFELKEFEKRSIQTLSGGEFQRVQIARAFFQNSPIIVLDEPTAALDIGHCSEVYSFLKRLVEEEEKTVILVTHDLAYVANYCDVAHIMHRGKVVLSGSPREIINEESLYRYFKFKGMLEKFSNTYSIVEKKL